MKSKKSIVPKSLTQPSTPKSKAESKTSQPKARNLETPRVPFAPKSPQRKQGKMMGKARD